jgi:REP element-mobilizing transposase RayT
LEYPGAIYHVTVRMLGDGRLENSRLFCDDRDRLRMLERLAAAVERFGVRLYQYCLMANHLHLVLETPVANLSKFMQSVSTGYTVYYNLRHGRHGHLLDGRFKAKVVEGDRYLLALSRYVHLNPVQVQGWAKRSLADRVARLRAYPWSTYPGYIGKARRQDFVDYEAVLALVGGRQAGRSRSYCEFVEAGLAESDKAFAAIKNGPGLSIGGRAFEGWAQELYRKRVDRHARVEDVALRRVSKLLDAEDVLRIVGAVLKVAESDMRRRRRDSTARAVAARFLTQCAGLTQREAAHELGIGSGAAVCMLLKGLPGRMERSRALRAAVETIAARVQAARGG